MQAQRRRPLLEFEHACYGRLVVWIAAEAEHGLGRVGDHTARAQRGDSFRYVLPEIIHTECESSPSGWNMQAELQSRACFNRADGERAIR